MHISEIEREYLRTKNQMLVVEWLRSFIDKPHQQLGRQGSVCPWVGKSLKEEAIWVGFKDTINSDEIASSVYSWVENFSYVFQKRQWDFAFAIEIFPKASLAVLESVQQRVKPGMVRHQLMVGEFHPDSQVPGLHNLEFMSQRSPVPLIAVRQMVAADLPFLLRAKDTSHTKILALKAYLSLPNLLPAQTAEATLELGKIAAKV